MTELPYSAACERNRDPILAVLRRHFADRREVLEIGSGTGQHAVYFAAALPHLHWQTSDVAQNLPGIRARLVAEGPANAAEPLLLDVAGAAWPLHRYDAVFSANTLHIMSWTEVEVLFAALPNVVGADAKLVIYGPFNYAGRYTSPSNEQFDEDLKARAPHMGIRDFEAVAALAASAGFDLCEDAAMPANNRCLVWQRRGVA
jgi:cyclopropane fatty-acyl-phospholipid synthase-like methyltransferase